jgi:Tfp pilus assembly ATPase PilU
MGSSLRTRETIALGENENRRLSDIIEAGHSYGWHSFEQSLIKAYEEDLITEETAMLYCISKSQMRQRIDIVNKRRATSPTASTLKMKMDEILPEEVPPPETPPTPPTASDKPATLSGTGR